MTAFMVNSEEVAMSIGAKVRQLRTARKLTQQELAERAGVSQAIISKIETEARDNVTSDVLKALAKTLGCTTDYLVGMHEDEESETLAASAA
jgi:transcriptional regulator with XRE-family HTH domain